MRDALRGLKLKATATGCEVKKEHILTSLRYIFFNSPPLKKCVKNKKHFRFAQNVVLLFLHFFALAFKSFRFAVRPTKTKGLCPCGIPKKKKNVLMVDFGLIFAYNIFNEAFFVKFLEVDCVSNRLTKSLEMFDRISLD